MAGAATNQRPNATESDTWPIDAIAERELLGTLILDPRHLGQLAEIEPELFALSSHRLILAAIRDLVDHGCKELDYLELTNSLRRRGDLNRVGGIGYVIGLGEGVVPRRSLNQRLQALREFAMRRKLILIGVGLAEKAADCTADAAEIAQWATSQINEAGGSRV